MTKLEASLLDILKEDCRIPLEKMAVMTGTSLEEVAAAIDSLEGGKCTAHRGVGFHLRMLIGLDIVVDIVAVVEHRDVGVLPVDGSTHTEGSLSVGTGGTQLAPLGVERLVVEPHQIVVGLEKHLGPGRHIGGVGRGHVARILVELGKLFHAGAKSQNADGQQGNENMFCFHVLVVLRVRI